jgi:hypothetical protein
MLATKRTLLRATKVRKKKTRLTKKQDGKRNFEHGWRG